MKNKKIYIAIWNDRHSDTTAYPFSTAEKALAFARKKAKEYSRDEEDYWEKSYEDDDSNWLLHATYSCEGDGISVEEREIDKEEV
jgi:hypothetical protein